MTKHSYYNIIDYIACAGLYISVTILGFFLTFYLFILRERRKEGEREGGKHQCVVASHTPSTGDLACNPGMCPDWELNW